MKPSKSQRYSRAGPMPELALRVLMRLLPWTTAHDVFEPAAHDLRIEYLLQRSRAHARARAVVYGLRLLLLFLDCWRIALTDLPNLSRPRHSADRISQEPV